MKIILLLVLPIFGFGQIKLEKKISILNQKVELLVPNNLSEMTSDAWKLKYGNAKQPILVLSDKDGEVNLIGQMTNQPWEEKDLDAYKDFRIENLKKTRPDVQVVDNGAKVVQGKKVGFFKFTSKAVDTKIFNYYFFTIIDGNILIFTFNCPEKLRESWEKVADEIVASLNTR